MSELSTIKTATAAIGPEVRPEIAENAAQQLAVAVLSVIGLGIQAVHDEAHYGFLILSLIAAVCHSEPVRSLQGEESPEPKINATVIGECSRASQGFLVAMNTPRNDISGTMYPSRSAN